jgi:hypothetical protein
VREEVGHGVGVFQLDEGGGLVERVVEAAEVDEVDGFVVGAVDFGDLERA